MKIMIVSTDNSKSILKSIQKKPRQGWAEAFKMMHERKEDRLLMKDALDVNIKNWQW
ncbi:MAG: hypothetical protein HQL15_10260 [Candidatus Omnitrophica bacterium]|nr:hypothetical protein [Candidatus Omnitrophota bacterium]